MPAVCAGGRVLALTVDEPGRPSDRVPPFVARLSLVVRLVDPFGPTGQPRGAVNVRLDPEGRRPTPNLSGDQCFLDLPAGAGTLAVETEYYFLETLPVSLPLPDPRNPVQTILLRPLPSYPFSPGTTSLRGVVRTNSGAPVPGAKAAAGQGGPRTETTERGEFCLAWPALDAAHVVTERRDGVVRRFVSGDGGKKQIQVVITHPDFQSTQVDVMELEDGMSLSIGVVTVTK